MSVCSAGSIYAFIWYGQEPETLCSPNHVACICSFIFYWHACVVCEIWMLLYYFAPRPILSNFKREFKIIFIFVIN